MRRQAKSALLDTAKWATGKPANRHKLQKNRTFVVQLCCPNSQTLHVPFKRKHVSKCLGCCEQQFYSWVLWEPGSGRSAVHFGISTVLFGITYGLPYCINRVDVELISWVTGWNIKGNCTQLSNNTRNHSNIHSLCIQC